MFYTYYYWFNKVASIKEFFKQSTTQKDLYGIHFVYFVRMPVRNKLGLKLTT